MIKMKYKTKKTKKMWRIKSEAWKVTIELKKEYKSEKWKLKNEQ